MESRNKIIVALIILLKVTLFITAEDYEDYEDIEYPPYDGWYNNFAHPDWGAAETPLLRLLPHAYSDGVYQPSGANRPNPIAISQIVFNGSTGHRSHRNRTALLVFFGQQVVEEILDAQRPGCPPEYFNIKIPKGHPEFDPNGEGGREMPLLRNRFDQRTGHSPNVPREQLNEISAYFDGTLMYGPNKAWTDALRLFKGGRLKATNDTEGVTEYFPALNHIRLPFANPPPPRDHYLKPVSRFFTIGNPRGNENPFLLTFGILWFRYHNYKADEFNRTHPDWSDEKIFNEARKWVIATHQKIVYFDWLAAWLNETLPEYKGYNPHVHPGIAHVFQSAAMRFGHTLVPPGVLRRNASCFFRTTSKLTKFEGHLGLRTCNTYWNPQEAVREYDIDELLMGMASQTTEREDNIITPDLRGNVFGTLDYSRRDLMAINIQRGRDHGLPDYNTARAVFGLEKRTNFSQINPTLYAENQTLFEELEKLYGEDGINNLDIWPAGILETTEKGPGELFRAIIKNQFGRIRDGDRFWFENYKNNKLFTQAEFEQIKNTTIKDVIMATTNIGPLDIQDNPFFHVEGDVCPEPSQRLHHGPGGGLEECTPLKSIDYFDGSQASYIGTLILIFGTIILAVGILLIIAKCTNKSSARNLYKSSDGQEVSVMEWTGPKEGKRLVTILMDCSKKQILVKEESKLLRIIDIALISHNGTVAVSLSGDLDMRMMSLRVPKEYDLILNFKNSSERQEFLNKLKNFLLGCGAVRLADPTTVSEKMMKSTAITRATRQAKLEAFFDAIFSHALHYQSSSNRQSLITSESDANDIVNCELTKFEFAEALGLKADSMFVENMFKIVDTNENGYISFREFLDFFVIFSKGSPDEKMKLMFDMYDLRRTGRLSKEDFKTMLKSMIELANERVEDDKIDQLAGELFRNSKLESKSHITFEDFKQFLKEYEDDLDYASLSFQFGDLKQPAATNARRENAPTRARRTIIRSYGQPGTNRTGFRSNRSSLDDVKTVQRKVPTTAVGRLMNSFVKYFENYRRQIFWATLYTLVVAGIFIERAYYYSLEREYSGLRRTLGYGVSITRGAASAMMFTYSSMLVTMCRSIIALLRESFLNRFIPFDSAVAMHSFIGYQAAIYTLAHVIGHCFNFYHISTQTPGDLGCLFRNFHHRTDYLPKFNDWAWDTITGCTGILMCLQITFIYVFSNRYARRKAFRAFWLIHSTYPVFFILMILHGAGRFIQAPFFYYFFLGPVILFTLDKLISISRSKIEISVVKAELLPSDVTYLELRKPPNFEYRSGQWVRIACLGHSGSEYHPLTLTSAPHENHLSVHVRAVGPWTRNIRKLYDPRQLMTKPLPKVFVDGPYGLGHQDWSKYEVSVLIGGGIGVTPFASILKDIAHRSEKGNIGSVCKKVYFIWVTRTQRHFEWMTDIIREVEQKDHSNIVVVNTFITQFKEKFDFRTTMLYICERHFQKISDRSLFTGLRSTTHFGRPDFSEILKVVMKEHPSTNVFGVFSCGPPPLTRNVEQACSRDNAYTSDVLFVHHQENL